MVSGEWTVPADPRPVTGLREGFDDVCPASLGDGPVAEQAAVAVAELNARVAVVRGERLGGAA